jgi:hypothetical protein
VLHIRDGVTRGEPADDVSERSVRETSLRLVQSRNVFDGLELSNHGRGFHWATVRAEQGRGPRGNREVVRVEKPERCGDDVKPYDCGRANPLSHFALRS